MDSNGILVASVLGSEAPASQILFWPKITTLGTHTPI